MLNIHTKKKKKSKFPTLLGNHMWLCSGDIPQDHTDLEWRSQCSSKTRRRRPSLPQSLPLLHLVPSLTVPLLGPTSICVFLKDMALS